jgi:hypothetical protein
MAGFVYEYGKIIMHKMYVVDCLNFEYIPEYMSGFEKGSTLCIPLGQK